MAKMLTKQQLKARCTATGRRYRIVDLVDGSQVRLQSLTRSEQREWRKATQKKDGSIDPKKIEYSNDLLLSLTIVDEDGNPVFSVDDAVKGIFDMWDTRDTTRLVDAAVVHCGLVVDDEKEAGDAIKNSDATPGSGSSGVAANTSE